MGRRAGIEGRVCKRLVGDALTLHSIPPTPLKKGGEDLKVPLFKGDLGGSKVLSIITLTCVYTVAFVRGNWLVFSIVKVDLGRLEDLVLLRFCFFSLQCLIHELSRYSQRFKLQAFAIYDC
jgi:hypothetical protein